MATETEEKPGRPAELLGYPRHVQHFPAPFSLTQMWSWNKQNYTLSKAGNFVVPSLNASCHCSGPTEQVVLPATPPQTALPHPAAPSPLQPFSCRPSPSPSPPHHTVPTPPHRQVVPSSSGSVLLLSTPSPPHPSPALSLFYLCSRSFTFSLAQ